jgi:hypothetical protein
VRACAACLGAEAVAALARGAAGGETFARGAAALGVEVVRRRGSAAACAAFDAPSAGADVPDRG